jgi:hypothetical protein
MANWITVKYESLQGISAFLQVLIVCSRDINFLKMGSLSSMATSWSVTMVSPHDRCKLWVSGCHQSISANSAAESMIGSLLVTSLASERKPAHRMNIVYRSSHWGDCACGSSMVVAPACKGKKSNTETRITVTQKGNHITIHHKTQQSAHLSSLVWVQFFGLVASFWVSVLRMLLLTLPRVAFLLLF